MKIVVLAGGLSPERDVSLSSGSLIANALIENGHSVCLLDLYKGTDASVDSLFYDLKSGKKYSYTVPQHEPDLKRLKAETNNDNSLIGDNVINLCKAADMVFLALHGDIGENGKLQAVFDVLGIKYTGTGYAGSLLAMDKDIAKQIMVNNSVLTPPWILVDIESNSFCGEIEAFGFPCVIKPCSCGSSVGITIVNSEDELKIALEYAKNYERYTIVEKKISGREFSVGVLGSCALPAIEIIPNEGFYDYKNKYQPGLTKEVCPAEISDDIMKRLQEAALCVHKILRLGDYSRIDFMLSAEGNIYCLEANTLPGMTPTSLLPQMAAAAGISYNELCNRIAEMAIHA